MFKDSLTLWLAGFGMDESLCEKVCQDPLMAQNIARRDGGAVVQDLPKVLFKFGPPANEAFQASNDTKEKFFLMMALQ